LVFAFLSGPGTDGREEEDSWMPTLKGQFGTAQLEDRNLLPARSNVLDIEGKRAPGLGKLTYPCFTIENNLLYYTKETEGQRRDLLVVPKPFVSTVLHLTHSHVLGAHLGVEKTRQRIASWFHWPGVVRMLPCAECQKMSPKPHFKSPLIPLPIIDVPFPPLLWTWWGP